MADCVARSAETANAGGPLLCRLTGGGREARSRHAGSLHLFM
jgi:hypothetical protein